MKTFLITITAILFVLQSNAQISVTNDSIPSQKSDNPVIKIRCGTSVLISESPLFIIDGIPVMAGEKTFENLNPVDIESIEVLRNPEALLCYGTAAQNGVVLITTKKAINIKKFQTKSQKKYALKVYDLPNTNWTNMQDVYNTIDTKVPGVNIQQTSTSIVPKIKMRGDDNIIVIVDGFRYDASILNTLSAADIESIKVATSVAAGNYLLNNRN